jgi:hypothetical protein
MIPAFMVSDFLKFSLKIYFNIYFKGYTPLFAAVAARRWSTAKLILAIAAAQYHPENEDDKIVSFNVDWGK